MRMIRLFMHGLIFFLFYSFVPPVFDARQRLRSFTILSDVPLLQRASLFSPLASAAQRRGERGAGGVGGKKSANPSMFLCTNPKDLAM